MTIGYRDAIVADAPAIERLFRLSFIDTFGHLYRPDDLVAFLSRFTVAAWEEEISDPAFAFRVAEEAGEGAGFAKIGPLGVPFETSAPALELRQLYILPEWKGRGIGPALVEWALGGMRRRGAEEAYLSVYADNHRAQRLYERFGFERVGTYQFMVGGHADDEYIMRLTLRTAE